ncbi:helix-turn-helix domain-containing protein [Robertmurraya andreesenii]|uniref:Transcriptional regulator with XRE-family HTH domain n=1 Tax=Anoxybacillus andreesenii TaxID=1325932 RepID=A0ABT9UYT8_9BACL|nr:helix-turn-helix domain-containing protein [Robertmurraya andreesenii]MDQ0153810.1 transcriptional regulator with XRE-family HTH domain [Robertmurraya andreesenii]
MNIGETIKSLRKLARMSQTELSKGICSQAQLSKIETKGEIPSATVLYKFSKKLGVDMNYFFELIETPRLDYIREVKKLMEECKKERNYHRLRDIVQSEKRNPLFQGTENKQFLLWHEAICFHYIEKESDQAITLLYDALSITENEVTKFYRETEIEILNSIAIIKKDQKLYEQAESIFLECLHLLKFIPSYNIIIKIRLLYGFSKLLTDKGDFIRSVTICKEGIDLCKKIEVLYLFGELQYQLGSNYARMQEHEKALEAFDHSINIFLVQDNHFLVTEVQKYRKELLGI